MAFDSKKLLKTLTAGHGTILVPHINAYQARANFPAVWNIEIRNQKPEDGHFHPSSDAFAPPLDLWKAKKGLLLRSPITPALRRTFDCGHMWHGYLQEMLIEMGLVERGNVERYIAKTRADQHGRPFTCAGTADLVDVDVPGHGKWLVDIKTMNHTEFGQGASDKTLLKWKAQVSCYMDWLGAERAFVLAICKDSPHDMREYQIQKDDTLLGEIYDRWGYVAQCLRADVEPDENWKGYEPDPALLNPGDSVLDVEIAAKGDNGTGLEHS